MTAPEQTRPTDEHIDAVARAINAPAFRDDDRFPGSIRAMHQDAARRDAEAILTSTDPTVHAALAASLPPKAILDALVEASVLTEDRERLVRACGCIANEEPAACCDPLASPHWERRLVARWEVTE